MHLLSEFDHHISVVVIHMAPCLVVITSADLQKFGCANYLCTEIWHILKRLEALHSHVVKWAQIKEECLIATADLHLALQDEVEEF